MTENRTVNVVKNSAASLMFKGVSILYQFALRTAFIYMLGNEYTGISVLFTDILMVLSLMEAGLDSSMVYALYKPLACNDEKRISALMKFYKKAFIVIGVVVLLAGSACVPFLGYIVHDIPNVKEDIRLIFMMYVLTSASSYFFVYKIILIKADQKARVVSKWSAIIQIFEGIIEISLLFIFKEFFIYLGVHFVAMLAKNIILSWISTKMYPQYFIEKNAELEKGDVIRLFRDILCITAYNLSGIVIYSTDSIFISMFVGTVEVAIIGNYMLIINSVRTCVEQVIAAIKPSIGNLAATSTKLKQEEIFSKMNFMSFYVSCFCCSCFAVLITPFISEIWFDSTYRISEIAIIILIVNFYIAIMVFPVESFRTANGLFVQGWGRPIIMATMNIILDFYMGMKWGVIGIFLATTISRTFTQVWFDSYLVYKWVFGKKPWSYYADYIKKSIMTIIICVITTLCANISPFENVYLSFSVKVLVAIIVPNILLALVYWKNDEWNYMINVIKKNILKR